MSKLLKKIHPEVSVYKDRRFEGDERDWQRALRVSTTLYIGNLSFFTREEQIYEVFSKVGHVERVIMGLDKNRKTPCGFAFVLYYTRPEADAAVKYLNGTMVDDRPIRVDHDWGFMEGRQWGRGQSGGQVRDEFRLDYDPGRGGFGKVVQQELVQRQMPSPDTSHSRPAGKRQRMEGGEYSRGAGRDVGQGYADRSKGYAGDEAGRGRPREDNPRFDRKRSRRDSDDEDDR